VYDLPSTEEVIKWMHAMCGYPVKSTWIKAIKAGNYIGWPMLTEKNVAKYYPESTETPKGHMNQTRKNVRSTKPKAKPMEDHKSTELRGKKVRDIYTKVYDVRETVFSDQTGQFPTRSQRGNKYIMVMVEIDSNAILVEPITSRKDAELTRAYRALMLRLQRGGIIPKKHILDNEVSQAMKDIIRDEYKMEMELVPPPAQCSGGGNQKLQGSLPQCVSRDSDGLPTITLGQAAPTNRNHTQPIETVQCNSKRISICASQRTI
jgi:hypothetical protein